ncbi:MAG: alpha/beta fold hydrolase [Pseudomonadota bacterium]
MDGVITRFVPGHDGAGLALHRLGSASAGRPMIMLHGLFSNAAVNWIKFGTAARLAAAGFDPIMPDFRAHGQSPAPRDAAAYPADVLVKDLQAIIGELRLGEFDLCGFSLGARVALRAVTEAGFTPRRLILCGMGLEGIVQWERRIAFFLDVIDRYGTIPRGDPAYFAQAFMRSTGVDLVAARHLLQSFTGSGPDSLARATMPTRLICGADDHDNGSAQELANALPDATYVAIPGTHMSSVTMPELAEQIIAFLQA